MIEKVSEKKIDYVVDDEGFGFVNDDREVFSVRDLYEKKRKNESVAPPPSENGLR